jgi:hypothetical protein
MRQRKGMERRMVSCALALSMFACSERSSPVITRLIDARRIAAELQLSFSHAADATDRAVMADTDEASIRFAHEADAEAAGIDRESQAIESIVRRLHYARELKLLGDFRAAFARYRALDREILSLAVENTNLKAQRLSFGPAYAAANDLAAALRPALNGEDETRKALATTVVLAVREVEVLEAPHIAAADDATMAALETQMSDRTELAKRTLAELRQRGLAADGSQVALDRFIDLHRQLIALSRRNSNVRSLALALGRQRTLSGVCEDQLRALNDQLAQHDFIATR